MCGHYCGRRIGRNALFCGNIRICPDAAFSVNWTGFAIFMVVIDGIGRIEGPIIGALICWGFNKFFSDFATWYLIGIGILAIFTTIYFKQGFMGLCATAMGHQLVSD